MKKDAEYFVDSKDRDVIFSAQSKLWGLHGRLRSWRAVARKIGVNVSYISDLVLKSIAPSNKDVRKKIFLPRCLPSELRFKQPAPRLGQNGWEGAYFKKVKR